MAGSDKDFGIDPEGTRKPLKGFNIKELCGCVHNHQG